VEPTDQAMLQELDSPKIPTAEEIQRSAQNDDPEAASKVKAWREKTLKQQMLIAEIDVEDEPVHRYMSLREQNLKDPNGVEFWGVDILQSLAAGMELNGLATYDPKILNIERDDPKIFILLIKLNSKLKLRLKLRWQYEYFHKNQIHTQRDTSRHHLFLYSYSIIRVNFK
jgi:hypothetical protein